MGHDGNGNAPIRFPASGAIPIVGQPFEISQFSVTALLICKCDGPHPLLVMMNGVTPCPACGKAYTIQGCNLQPGQPPHFAVGLISASSTPPPTEPQQP